MDLHIHLGEGLLHEQHLARGALELSVAVAQDAAKRTNGFRRPERASQQSHAMEILQPLAIDHIALAPRNVLDMLGVDQAYLEAYLF